MAIDLHTPTVHELVDVVGALQRWQREGAPMQLHPGDLGWFWRFGADAMAAALRVWTRDDLVVAIGMLDEPTLLRMTLAPDAYRDEGLALRLARDVALPQRGVLPEGEVFVEAPTGVALHDELARDGWTIGEAWTPLWRDLAAPVEQPTLRIEVVGPDRVAERVRVQRASFETSKFTEERWRLMAEGAAYAHARCLLAYDGDDAVAAVTVWSAGPGKPGLIEPLGVHKDHRGHGFGRAITLGAARALRDLGSSSAVVATPSANVAGVATYVSAGFEPRPEVFDRRRSA